MAIKIGTAKISNSYRGLRFKVEKRDIEQGQPNDPCACAAARALLRHTGAEQVFVYRDVTYVKKSKDVALRYKTTPALRLETVVFDRDGNFVPGEYDLGPGPVAPAKPTKKSASAPKRHNSGKARYVIPNVRPTASQRLGAL